ncbi:DUF488 family protein [Nicoliella sp. Es01]|uniref:DUF488 family protein n=1 Tax=Nicoliella lavandulae TaxID=3082954 RepID=A0ABU8SPA6_9LACO
MLKIERIYSKPFDLDGYRILVDRKWARGISKADAKLDQWEKAIAPSTELREWFNHIDDRFDEFERKYIDELKQNPATDDFVKLVAKKLQSGDVILLYGAKNTAHNNAVVLKHYLTERLHLTSRDDHSLINLLYNDGQTNHDKRLNAAIDWLGNHPDVIDKYNLSINGDKLYEGSKTKALSHQELLALITKD